MYRNSKSLSCALGTSIVLCVNYVSNKLIRRGWGNLMKVHTTSQLHNKQVLYNMTNIIDTGKWQPIPVFLPGSPVSYSPWGRKELDTTGVSNRALVALPRGPGRLDFAAPKRKAKEGNQRWRCN